MAEILVVDDEIGIRELLSEILADEGHSVLLAENAGSARRQRESRRPDLVLLDIWMPDTDGITLLKEWAGNGQLTMPVVMMSGHGTIETAVEATRIGALDYLEKPIALQRLLSTVKRALRYPDLAAYYESARGGGLHEWFDGVRGLLELFELEKALYELRYEINNRPGWVRTPLLGILALAG